MDLSRGASVEAELAEGKHQRYRLRVPPGRFVALAVEQLGCDVSVDVLTRDGRKLYEVDSPIGGHGRESIYLLGEPAGVGELAVRPGEPQALCAYRLVVEDTREATARDRKLVAAEQAFARAEEHRRRRDGASLAAALSQHQAVLALLHELGDRARQADSYDRLGRIHIDSARYAEALDAYLQALALLAATGREDLRGAVRDGIGRAYDGLGQPENALASYHEALAFHRAAHDAQATAKTLNSLGRLQEQLGQFDRAVATYNEALGELRRLGDLGDRTTEGVILNSQALLHLKLGKPRRALDLADRARTLVKTKEPNRAAAVALDIRGRALARLDRSDEALQSFEEALAEKRRLGDRREEAITLNNLATVLYGLDKTDSVRETYLQVLGVSAQLGDRRFELAALVNLGWLALGDRRPAAALDWFRRALPLATALEDRENAASALMGISFAERERGDLDAAVRAAEEALAGVESLRGEVASSGLRASFLATKHDYYRALVDLLMARHERQPEGGFAAAALEADERARARSLLEELVRGGERREMVDQRASLSQRIQAATRWRDALVGREAPEDEVDAAERSLRELVSELDALPAEQHRGQRAGTTIIRPLRLAEIQQLVGDRDTVLLQYSLGLHRSFVWAVSPNRLTVRELASRAEIERLARDAYRLLTASERSVTRSALDASLRALSASLLAPIAAELTTARRLVVVADGALYMIPFAVLPTPGAEEECLLDRHEVVALPSPSTLAVLRGRRRSPQRTVAVVADPVFEASDPRREEGQALVPRRLRSAEPSRFVRLPYAAAEAKAILQVAPRNSFVASGFAANRSLLADRRLASAGVLHFATHAVIDNAEPELSGLALSTVDEQGNRRAGIVFAYEIHDLSLSADLVVLSACETALGKDLAGEGTMGLSRAFFIAGARRVLVTLWPVDDQATAALMGELYQALLTEGRSPAGALREAQRAIRARSHWEEPYFWAGFELQGDWR